jgi:hypothetical protein
MRSMPVAFRGRPARPGPAFRPRVSPGHAPIRHVAVGYFPGTACYNNPSYAGSFYCSSLFPPHPHQPIFGAVTYVPTYWGVPLESESEAEPQAVAPEQDNSVAAQLQVLTDEVELMREEQFSRPELRLPGRVPRESSMERPEAQVEKRAATTFVYRDGHQLEAQNFAIMGKTLWVFGEQSTRKIPMADLDLTATQKANDDRGVDFAPPSGN